VEVSPVVIEVRPVNEMRPVIGVTVAVEGRAYTITATAEHWCRTEAAAMNRTAAKTAAMECGTAAPESTTVESAAAETAAATTESATASHTAVLNFGRQSAGCVFR
jgi:hypothetical protein